MMNMFSTCKIPSDNLLHYESMFCFVIVVAVLSIFSGLAVLDLYHYIAILPGFLVTYWKIGAVLYLCGVYLKSSSGFVVFVSAYSTILRVVTYNYAAVTADVVFSSVLFFGSHSGIVLQNTRKRLFNREQD